MMMKKLVLASAFVLSMTILSGTAWADNITIANPSFQTNPGTLTPNCPLGGPTCAFNMGPIDGWSTTGGQGGYWQPGSYFPGLAAGDLIGYVNFAGSLSQTLTGNSVLANSIYTLSVSVGDRAIDGLSGGYTLSLDTIVGGVTTALCSFTGNASTIGSGMFQVEGCTYTSSSSVPSGNLFLQLTAKSGQLDVDNVSLTVQSATTSVPEPSSVLLLSFGMLFLLSTLVVRRKKELQLAA
jgi:HpiC1 cyclase/PEP-CTERM motif